MLHLLWRFTVLLLVRHIFGENFCRETNVVNGSVGDNVTLLVSQENIEDITWSYGNNRIASTKPQEEMDVTNRFRGKLESDQDGSLIVMNLQQEDEGTYDASIKLRSGDMCTVHHQLHVYKKLSVDDIRIEHNVFSHEPCHVTLNCSASGSDVTIAWIGSNGTRNVVNVTDPNTLYTCRAQNPVSNSSKSIAPRNYCENRNGYRSKIVSMAFISVIIITIIFYIYYEHQKRTGRDQNQTSSPQ
ncbi:SLAM family member 5 [Bufo bufo]|uniref:SLAM family member 5 n=1 Tax=Bufo bufo TaxID=8384 RepID=UPI001ABEDA6A|nr:SLAM family member 5 [Bufo bufo]